MTPLTLVILGFFLSSFLLVVWNCYSRYRELFSQAVKGKKSVQVLLEGSKGVLFIVYVYFALLMLNSVIKIGFYGVLGYGNINYHLFSLTLATLFSVFVLLKMVFVSPSLKTLVSFIGITIYCLFIFHSLDSIWDFNEGFVFSEPLKGVLLISCGLYAVFFIIESIKKSSFQPLWNLSQKLSSMLSLRVLWILWLLFSIEFILKIEGLSLLYWI